MASRVPAGYSVRRLTEDAHIAQAARLVGSTRVEPEAGSFGLDASVGTYERQFRWLQHHSRGAVFGVFTPHGELVGAAAFAPLSLRMTSGHFMLTTKREDMSRGVIRAQHGAWKSAIRQFVDSVSARSGHAVSRERICLFFGLAVRPNERRKGLARLLLDQRLHAAGQEFDHVVTGMPNPNAHRMLEGSGFTLISAKPGLGRAFRTYHKALRE